jgi:hypothetical protein
MYLRYTEDAMGSLVDEAKRVRASIKPSAFGPMDPSAAAAIGAVLVQIAEQVEAQQQELEQIREGATRPALPPGVLPPSSAE